MDHPHWQAVPGSFRDPAGFVFTRDGRIHRQVNTVYADNYCSLMDSGLYRHLVSDGLLIAAPAVAHAYIDPGTGSILVQGLIAAIVGALFTIKI